MKQYRTSGARLVILVVFGTIVALIMAFGKARTLEVFFGIEAVFLLMAFAAWAYTAIRFEGEDIVSTMFLVRSTKRPISTIKRIRFDIDEDNFGGRTTYAIIEFRDAKPFFLFDFSKADLREIAGRISSSMPNVIDPILSKYLAKETTNGNWRTALRPGDRFIFTSGALFVLIAALWWILQRFWI